MTGEAISAAQTLTLRPADRLTFLTDGVVEAAKTTGELFGSERAQAISGHPAASIAQLAQTFGQNDEITVLRVEFTRVTPGRPQVKRVTSRGPYSYHVIWRDRRPSPVGILDG